jgi:hypothetical protein
MGTRASFWLPLLGLLVVALSAVAHTPYVTFASSVRFEPGATSLLTNERDQLREMVRKIRGRWRSDLNCPEFVGVAIARGEGRPVELQRKRLDHVKALLRNFGLVETAIHYVVVLKGEGSMPEDGDVIEIDGKFNVAWSQDGLAAAQACTKVFER